MCVNNHVDKAKPYSPAITVNGKLKLDSSCEIAKAFKEQTPNYESRRG